MAWNWELPGWPNWTYDKSTVAQNERQFLLEAGNAIAFSKTASKDEFNQFVVEILSVEGVESSRIEGEFLQRESLQSSIRRHFGLKTDVRRVGKKESGMAEVLCDVYESFHRPLTHEMLWNWHRTLFQDESELADLGKYRTHPEPMEIVSNRLDGRHVFFEAPPSDKVIKEMTAFIKWFNTPAPSEPILGRAATAHVYFESIHPFEDGNGRIGRVLVEKMISQAIGRPVLISLSKIIGKRKKEYYAQLGNCNKSLEIQFWVTYFAEVLLQAQEDAKRVLSFLIAKSKLLSTFSGELNARQEKALLRIFEEGPNGFLGGLSAENYIAITKASRATATRDLVDLVEKGALTKTGELRHTRYWLNLEAIKAHA